MSQRLLDLVADLNPPQREAVQHADGPLLVLAGPGSGKTRVITRRAAHLVRTGVAPWHVLAITFTNKAAEEMRRRITELGVARGMWVCTFHSLGARLLREYGRLTGLEPGFTIYDESDQLRCVKEALEACRVSPELLKPDAARARISDAKNKLRTPADFLSTTDFFEARQLGRVYQAYEDLLRQRQAVDFDDLLMRVALLLRDTPDLSARLNKRFRYLLIDEYQDTNHAQYLIARELSRVHRNICATGDPDQSIYGWRGADLANILDFERDYPDARVVRLEQNYRSAGAILSVAAALISHNLRRKHKALWTENPGGEPVVVWEFAEDRLEAERIAETLVAERARGRAWHDFAIFYRTNALSRGLEDSLRRRAIPYRMVRGVEFYNRREIKDLLGYLRLLANPADDLALARIINVPARGIGKTTQQRLTQLAVGHGRSLHDVLCNAEAIPDLASAAKKLKKLAELLAQMRSRAVGQRVSVIVAEVLRASGLEAMLTEDRFGDDEGEDRLANVQELVTAAVRYEEEAEEPTLNEFLQRISLVSDQDAYDPAAGAVQLMTLHAAKGLEFPVVFMVGLEQGLLPHERALMGDGELEEERRLCFVGITRARERLFLSHAATRLLRGALLPRCRSQFLGELGENGIDYEQAAPPTLWADRPQSMRTDPDEENALREGIRRNRRRWGESGDEPTFSPDDPVGRRLPSTVSRQYADWRVGSVVRHAQYGLGQLVSIEPSGSQTRAKIRFAGQGEMTFILESAPVQRLERRG